MKSSRRLTVELIKTQVPINDRRGFPRRPRPSAEDRLNSGVSKGAPDDCWEWGGYRDRLGYGVTTVHRQSELTHRVAYVLANGPIPDGMVVMHSCDNPPCCNPSHLSVGTKQDNSTDMLSKRRHRCPRGQDHAMGRYSDVDIQSMREARAAGESCASIARRFGTNDSYVSKLTRGLRRATA